jgi:alpha-ketoglutarate-dependent taurine dioxygenase
MTRNPLLLTFLLLVTLSSLGLAQETRRVLLLPVDIRGSRETLTSSEVSAFLESAVEQQAPGVDVVLPSRLLEESDNPPSLDDVRLLAKEYNASSVAWMTVRFRSQSLPTESMYTRELTLSAAARVWIYSAVRDQVIVDEPVSVTRQTPLSSSVGIATQAAAMKDLKFACGTELASTVVHAALDATNKTTVAAWKPTQAPEVTETGPYQHFLRAFATYQDAVRESDFVAAAAAQTSSRQAWAGLTVAEQAKAEAQFPGVQGWLGE